MNILSRLPRLMSLIFGCWLITSAATAQPQDTREYFGDTARFSALPELTDLDKALAEAKRTKKPVFVNCYAAWARPCVAMDQYVLSHTDFAQWISDRFVCLRMMMNTDAGKAFAEKYDVRTYATFLVLDADGNILHRIKGGSMIPEFKEKLTASLDPRTSLAGTQAKIATGKYKRQDLFHYVTALRTAGMDSLFNVYAREYAKDLDYADFAKEGHWMLVGLFRSADSDFYRFFVSHRDLFLKHNDVRKVENKFESFHTGRLLSQACGDSPYDSAAVAACRADIRAFGMSDTAATAILCDIADLRGHKQYADLFRYMEQKGRYLDKYYRVHGMIDLSFRFNDLSSADEQALIAYLTKAVEREKNTRMGRQLDTFLVSLQTKGKGITFFEGSFAEAQAKAKAEGKKIFMDCYTSWCGPCRMMAANIFTKQDVGECYNARFVCVKYDMEQGEGIQLAKRFQVRAFPTMLILDADGKVLDTIVGSCSGDELIRRAQEACK